MFAISIKNLVKRFGNRVAVDNLCLDINEGELLALLGMNGAGKTTTLNILSGLLTADDGDAFVFGKSVKTNRQKIKGLLNMSLQETAVAENLTVEENLEFVCRVYGFDKNQTATMVDQIMTQFALSDRQKDKASKLSGGYKRRLSIAMALVTKPKVVFLDEPTLGLDVVARRELWQVIKELKGKTTIILTTHYLEEAESLADRIAVMKDGRLCGLGSADELKIQTNTTKFEDAFLSLCGVEVQI